MSNDTKEKMTEIKEFLIGLYQEDINDSVKERIKLLLRNEVVTSHKCSKCGHKFETSNEDDSKSSLTIYP